MVRAALPPSVFNWACGENERQNGSHLPIVKEHMKQAQRKQQAITAQLSLDNFNTDIVLVLVSSVECKFLATWQAPFEVIERVGKVIYRDRQPGKRKPDQIYHVNLLKRWHPRYVICCLSPEEPSYSPWQEINVSPHLNLCLPWISLALDYPCCRVLFGYFILLAWTLACFGLLLCSALWITIPDVLTHTCVRNIFFLSLFSLVFQCRSSPVMTTSLFNKSLHMDPHASAHCNTEAVFLQSCWHKTAVTPLSPYTDHTTFILETVINCWSKMINHSHEAINN